MEHAPRRGVLHVAGGVRAYGTIQQVSQPTTAPKNNFDPGEKTMRESRVSVLWRHAKRPAAGLLGSLHASRYTHPQTHPLGHFSKKNTLGQAPSRQPCFSRLVPDAGAKLDGTVCSRRGSLSHGRSRSVGLSDSIDRSFGNFGVLSALSAGATRPAANTMVSVTLSRASLEAALPREPVTPRKRASNPLSKRIHHPLGSHSASYSLPGSAGPEGLCSVCDDTHAASTISIAFCHTSSTTGPTS